MRGAHHHRLTGSADANSLTNTDGEIPQSFIQYYATGPWEQARQSPTLIIFSLLKTLSRQEPRPIEAFEDEAFVSSVPRSVQAQTT